jgi:hypothetical protein
MTHLDTLERLEPNPSILDRSSLARGCLEPSLGSGISGRAERPTPASPFEVPPGCFDSERSYNATAVRPVSTGSWGAASVQLAPLPLKARPPPEGTGKTSVCHPT